MTANFNPNTDNLNNARQVIKNRAFPFLNQGIVLNLKGTDPQDRRKNARAIGASKSLFCLDWIHRHKYSHVSILTRILNNFDDSATYKQLKTLENRGLISWVVHDSDNMPNLVKVTKKGFDIIQKERMDAFGSNFNKQRPKDQRPSEQLPHALLIQEVIANEIEEYPDAHVITESECFRMKKILKAAAIVKTPDAFINYGDQVRAIEVEKSGKHKIPRHIAVWNAELLLRRNAADFVSYYVPGANQKAVFESYLSNKMVPRYDVNGKRDIHVDREGNKYHHQTELRELAADGVCDVFLIPDDKNLAKYLKSYRPAKKKIKPNPNGPTITRTLVIEKRLLKLIAQVKTSLELKKSSNEDEYLLLRNTFIGVAIKKGSIEFDELFSASKEMQRLLIKVLKMRELVQSESDDVLLENEAAIIYGLY